MALMLRLFVEPPGVYLLDFFCTGVQFYLLLSPYICFISFLYLDLYVLGDDNDKLGIFHANQIYIVMYTHFNINKYLFSPLAFVLLFVMSRHTNCLVYLYIY